MPIANDVFEQSPAIPYADMRSQIQNGDILLCSGTAGFSKLIQKATRSPWSHVAFIWRLNDIDRIMVLESVDGAGVRTLALSGLVNGAGSRLPPYPGRLAIARHDDFAGLVSREKLRLMSQFAIDRFAWPYGMAQITKIAFRIVVSRLGIRLPALRPNGEYICSEYAAQCYEAIDLSIAPSKLGFIAPGDFASEQKINLVGVLKVPTRKEARARIKAEEAEALRVFIEKQARQREAAKQARIAAKAKA